MKKSRVTAVLPWLGTLLKPYRRRVAAACVALALGSLSWLALGQGVKLLVDEGFLSDNGERLNQIMLVVLGINLVGGAAAFFRFYLMSWLGERVSADIRSKVYQHLLTLSPDFYESTRTGEVISRFTSDTTVIQTVVGMSLSMALRSSVTLVGGLLMMLVTSPLMTLYVTIAVPVVLVPIKVLGAKVRTFARDSQDRVADIGAYVDETLHEIHTVQAYTHEQVDRTHFQSRVEAVIDAAASRIYYRGLLIALVMSLSIGAITVVAWLGALQVLSGGLSAGELTAFLFYAVMVAGAVATISEVIGEVQRAAGATERLMELLNTQPSIVAPASPRSLPSPVRGHLALQGLGFAYPSAPNLRVLSDLALTIEPGERVALVGPSGAGKSTLFQLLQHFYLPQQGRILLDGIDIQQLAPTELRQQFALVPQESVIFATSALENVRYGRPEATLAEVQAACRAARAHEFIQALPNGYDTDLGERGVRLSGGQKQRIAIARALLADRPVLLLDEATSALDAASEQQVKLALDELMKGKTTLIIAHRLATVVNADRIVVMEQGRIAAVGTHRELVAKNALYKQLADLQLVS
ncbi:ABC transporter transmembrane domain-containing protein [Ferrimonas sp. SCSIO 43195]|uniref:ABC transporter transmembrane domain-containing protein n=1 Tax=Ferrimonas sp. SCSIO 43195 TaxID=2822844 RepID=UPI0020755008|nr:ABC transporter transmembrane domain-containing protein [Ferrimonas sp. SCSIO 43195]USD38882.1 ATP-binding cassette domain-containing protein [Ferrimonas sp. SCSIO 43195]